MTRTALVPFVTTPAAKVGPGATTDPSASFTPALGDTIVVGLQFLASGVSNPSISDSQGLNWTTVALAGASTTGRFRVWAAQITNPANAVPLTVTPAFSAAVSGAVATFTTVRGGQLLTPSVVQATVSGAGQALTLTYPSAVLDGAGHVPAKCMSLAVFGASSTSGPASPADDAAYTQLANDLQILGSSQRNVVEEDYCPVNAPASMTWTTGVGGTGVVSAAAMMLFVPNPGPDPRVVSQTTRLAMW